MPSQFHGKEFTFTQPDGTSFQVKGWGDQHFAIFETLDGHTVVRDPVTGFYNIAVVSDTGDELEPSTRAASSYDPTATDVPTHLRISGESASAKGKEAFRLMGSGRRCEQRREERRNILRASFEPGGPVLAPPSRQTVGDFVGLCLLVEFSDEPASISQAQVDDFCNTPGYTGFGNNGSVYDYFHDNSLGLFRYTNIVTAYYKAKHPKTYYTDRDIKFGTRARQLIKEALDNLKAQGFDFSQLTVDSKGYVYAMNIYYAGPNLNNWSEGLWPHAWSLASEYDLGSGKVAYDYQFTDMSNELSLGTFCHENGHMVCDYPDLYDYGYESSGVGAYCLMCSGGRDEKNPTHISAYLKNLSGWSSDVTTITHGAHISLTAGNNEYAVFSKNRNEYFILENRNKTERDASLPASGLAIWHVDELGDNNHEQMTAANHYELSLEQADNKFDLEKRKNHIGNTGDLFHAQDKDRFADSTGPDSKWWDGTISNLDIYSISGAGSVIDFRAKLFPDENAQQSYHKTSIPGVSIPDNNSAGVSDTITFPDSVSIASIKVSVDISHTYRGDLIVTLFAPSGDSVVLHQRHQGGDDDDLKRSYDMTGLPALDTLIGQSMAGDWTLQVQDQAFADKGVLNSWELEIEGATNSPVILEESPGTHIPDNDPTGIERTLTSNAGGNVKEIEVLIEITHTYQQDLIVTLVSPSGTSVDLHNKSGGSADNIFKTYTVETTANLTTMINQAIQGDWKLNVSDHAGEDIGKLNRWQVKITSDIL